MKVKFEETKGVKYYCQLSDLKYFHIIDNPTVDIMHDVSEGVIPFSLKLLFTFCCNSKIFSFDELNSMIQYFDYGYLNNQNIPSEINLEKRSLGQNAAQSLCLFRNVPFILYKFRNHSQLTQIWQIIESLLRIVEIIYSDEITDSDLDVLNEMIHIHLEGIKTHGMNLLPKHHFMLHYAPIIRSLGPLVTMNMIRYESKHKVFKDIAKNTHNYKNINKTLALSHQKSLCVNGFTYKQSVVNGKTSPMNKNFAKKYENYLKYDFGTDVINVEEIQWLRIGNYQYRKDLLIIHRGFLYQMKNILVYKNRYYFMSNRFEVAKFERSLNSFQIHETTAEDLIQFSELKILKTYEMKSIESKKYVIADTLVFRNEFLLLDH